MRLKATYGFHLYRLPLILSRNKCLKVDFSKWQIIHNKDSGKQGHTYNRLLFTVSPPIVGRCQRWRVWGWLSFSSWRSSPGRGKWDFDTSDMNQQMPSTLFPRHHMPFLPTSGASPVLTMLSLMEARWDRTTPHHPGVSPESGQIDCFMAVPPVHLTSRQCQLLL